jgi:glycosyltransferase involved in cell wall biosynthesis
MEKFISVIIPTYNRQDFLKKAIDSVLAQTYPHYELIIVDDGSEDNTPELVAGYKNDIVYIRQNNKGPAAARNTGIRTARSSMLAFLDSDDWFAENKLAVQLSVMQADPAFLICHTQETWFRNGKILNQKAKHKKNSGYIFNQSLKLCAVSMSTVMIRREVFDTYGLFDEYFSCCEDYEFWLRVSAEQDFLLVDEPLTLKDGGRDDQVSSIYRTGMDKFRIKAIRKILASGSLSPAQTRLAFTELSNKCRIYGNGCLKHGRNDEGNYYLGLPDQIAEQSLDHSND